MAAGLPVHSAAAPAGKPGGAPAPDGVPEPAGKPGGAPAPDGVREPAAAR